MDWNIKPWSWSIVSYNYNGIWPAMAEKKQKLYSTVGINLFEFVNQLKDYFIYFVHHQIGCYFHLKSKLWDVLTMCSSHCPFDHTAYLLNTEKSTIYLICLIMDGRGNNQWDFLISVVAILNHAPWLRI